MLPLRWITRQTSGWWRTWTPWMTTWLRFSTRPLTSLSLSSGGTVSWEDVHFERDCCLSGGVWCGNIFHVDFPVSSWLSFFFLLSAVWTFVFAFLNPTCFHPFLPLYTPIFVCHFLVSLGLRGTELSESLFLSAFSYSTFRLRWLGFFSLSLLLCLKKNTYFCNESFLPSVHFS